MTRTAVYRCYDAEGALLYVGRSARPVQRLYEHKCRAIWADKIDRADLEWFDTNGEAKAAETAAIRSCFPLFNEKPGASDNQIAKMIDQWPTRGAFAAAVGASLAQVHKWAQNGRIPSDWQWSVLCAARSAGKHDITAEWMISAHARQPQKAAA